MRLECLKDYWVSKIKKDLEVTPSYKYYFHGMVKLGRNHLAKWLLQLQFIKTVLWVTLLVFLSPLPVVSVNLNLACCSNKYFGKNLFGLQVLRMYLNLLVSIQRGFLILNLFKWVLVKIGLFFIKRTFPWKTNLKLPFYLARLYWGEWEVNKHIVLLSNFYLLFILSKHSKTIIIAKKIGLFYC